MDGSLPPFMMVVGLPVSSSSKSPNSQKFIRSCLRCDQKYTNFYCNSWELSGIFHRSLPQCVIMLGTWGANLCRFSLVSVGKNILISANSKKLISVSRRFGPPPGVCNGFYETLPAWCWFAILWCRRIASPSKDASGRHEP